MQALETAARETAEQNRQAAALKAAAMTPEGIYGIPYGNPVARISSAPTSRDTTTRFLSAKTKHNNSHVVGDRETATENDKFMVVCTVCGFSCKDTHTIGSAKKDDNLIVINITTGEIDPGKTGHRLKEKTEAYKEILKEYVEKNPQNNESEFLKRYNKEIEKTTKSGKDEIGETTKSKKDDFVFSEDLFLSAFAKINNGYKSNPPRAKSAPASASNGASYRF